MTTHHEPAFSAFKVGKYLISPLTRLTDAGNYAPSVSIRSGGGRATHDRVFRFVARFGTQEAACRYACEQGVLWLQEAASPQSHRTH